MKYLKILTYSFAFFAMSLSVVSCGSSATENVAYTAAYVCPMHCEGSGSEEMGTCPACGMDYVMNEDHQTDGHTHEGH